MDAVEKKIIDIIDSNAERIKEYGRDIWAHGELGYREFRTAGKFADALESLNLQVERNIAVTGIKAVLGDFKPRIALMAELDALPLSEHPDCWKDTGAAHACGHHCQSTAVYGAAIALTSPDIRRLLNGSVAFCGTPAEEGVAPQLMDELIASGKARYAGGKSEWIRTGKFDDTDIAIGCHGGDSRGLVLLNASCNGYVDLYITFLGRAAHAAAKPDQGIDSQAAATLLQNALDAQRICLIPEDAVSIYGCQISSDGRANTIAAKTELHYCIRGKTRASIQKAVFRMMRCIRAAADAVGCGYKIRSYPGYTPWIPLPDVDVIEDALLPLRESGISIDRAENFHITASSDCSDVSMLMPMYQIHSGGLQGALHSADVKVTDENMLYIVLAKALALSVYHLLKDNAENAKSVIQNFVPPMTLEKYIKYKESFVFSEEQVIRPVPDFEE